MANERTMAEAIIAKHAKDYQLCWDEDYSNEGYLRVAAVWQKFADQGMSINLYSDPRRYEHGLVSLGDTIADARTAFRFGHKQLYYQNMLDLSGEEEIDIDGEKKIVVRTAQAPENVGCESGACAL